MIFKIHDDFFIQCEEIYKLKNNLSLGIFNFWINDACYPAKGINLTLHPLFMELTNNIESIEFFKSNLGDIPLSEIDFGDIDNDKLFFLDTGELFQLGFGLILGLNYDQERIFYTNDFENTYSEIILPKGTLQETLKLLLCYMKSDSNILY